MFLMCFMSTRFIPVFLMSGFRMDCSNYLFGVLDWKKCDSLRPGTAGGSAGIAGGKFYVDELQTAIFLVYYCDGGDVREEEKYGI